MKLTLPVFAILLCAGAPAHAHRLDQYLQGTLISIEKNRVDFQMTLTPGVAVFPELIAQIDTNADGVISESEQRAYAARVLGDLSIGIDGHPLTPHLLSAVFPPIEDMKEGRGEIQIEFDSALPPGGASRKLTLENHHESKIAAYQVNCLVPRDRDLRVLAQNRNYSQSFYELDYERPGAPSSSWSFQWLGAIAILVVSWLALLLRPRAEGERGKPRRRLALFSKHVDDATRAS